jgi:hypothetical protein
MKINYRTTAILVLLVLLAAILTPGSLTMRRPVLTSITADGSVHVDLCDMVEQIAWKYRLSALVWIVTFFILIVQGLRNRAVSRITALVSLVAFGITLYHELWRVRHCYSTFGIASFCLCTSAVALMCLHHFLHRPVHLIRRGAEAA